MDLNKTIDLVVFAIKDYRDEQTNRKISLLEFFSLTDVSLKELAKAANKRKCSSDGMTILNFYELHYWGIRDLNMKERFNNYHAFHGIELTHDDKLSIYQKMVDEGYPLLEGIYDRAAYYYANNIEFSKEEIRDKIIGAYNKQHPNAQISVVKGNAKKKIIK